MAEIRRRRKKNIPQTGSDTTRGIRNNNPLNLRISHNLWKEKVQGTDSEFETFSSMMWGLRAGMRNMRTHYRRGKNTIEQLISTWAPSNENDTHAYIEYVSKYASIPRERVFDWDKSEVKKIVKAMAILESRFEIPNALYDEAWENI